jgi:mannose-6-phosphate isomerase
MSEKVPYFDPSEFSNEPYAKRVDKPWGYELHLVPEDLPYMMKIIHVTAGCRLSEQVHDTKLESWTLLDGPGLVIWGNDKGELVTTQLEKGVGYTCQVGQPHRLAAGPEGNAVFFETSTPESGITYRTADDYGRPDETPEQRKIERGETA